MKPLTIQAIHQDLKCCLDTTYVFKPGYELCVYIRSSKLQIRLFDEIGNLRGLWDNAVPTIEELTKHLS